MKMTDVAQGRQAGLKDGCMDGNRGMRSFGTVHPFEEGRTEATMYDRSELLSNGDM